MMVHHPVSYTHLDVYKRQELDSALTEFKKVSDLSEEGLQSYTSQLSQAGKQFGRIFIPSK